MHWFGILKPNALTVVYRSHKPAKELLPEWESDVSEQMEK
jgi:hypothetical protein